MTRFRTLAFLTLGLMGCAGESPDTGPRASQEELPVASAGDPTLSIGAVEGDPDYLFESIRGLLRLQDGSVVVADAGGSSIAVFGPDGHLRQRFGGEGEGPGEFRQLAGVYPFGGDSLLALDGWIGRFSLFAPDGSFTRQLDPVRVSGDSVYQADVWPHGRFLVDGALTPPQRERARSVLASLPPPSGASHARLAWWAGDGTMWIRESTSAGSGSSWLVLDPTGQPIRWVDLPPRFLPMARDGDGVLGRRVGELDVESVEVRPLLATGGFRPPPPWIVRPAGPSDSTALERDELLDRVRTAMRTLAMAQEIHYAANFSYAGDVAALELDEAELPEGLEVQILSAGSRGWAMIAAHPDARVICTLGYGLDTPPGWLGGVVRCGH